MKLWRIRGTVGNRNSVSTCELKLRAETHKDAVKRARKEHRVIVQSCTLIDENICMLP